MCLPSTSLWPSLTLPRPSPSLSLTVHLSLPLLTIFLYPFHHGVILVISTFIPKIQIKEDKEFGCYHAWIGWVIILKTQGRIEIDVYVILKRFTTSSIFHPKKLNKSLGIEGKENVIKITKKFWRHVRIEPGTSRLIAHIRFTALHKSCE